MEFNFMQTKSREDEERERPAVGQAPGVDAELEVLRVGLIGARSAEEAEVLLAEFSRRVERLEREFRDLRELLSRVGPASKAS